MKTTAEKAQEFAGNLNTINDTLAFQDTIVEFGCELTSVLFNPQFGHTIDFKDGSLIRFLKRADGGWYTQTQRKRFNHG